jgi:serine/threonine-protein kinase
MTEAGSIIGTAQYISPEQARGLPVGPPADLYSVGVVLYKMLTGRVPFDGDSAVAVAMRHVQERPVPPSHLNPEIPPDLERVVLRALSKDVDRRYQTADEMGIDLDRVRKGLGVSQQTSAVTGATQVSGYAPPPPAIYPPRETYYAPPPPPPPPRDERGGSRAWVWLFVVLLIAAAVALAYIILTGDDDSPGRTDPTTIESTEASTEETVTTEETATTAAEVTVPDVQGLSADDAVAELEDAGLQARIVQVVSEEPEGTVLAQSPGAGETLAEGDTVRINVSRGVESIAVPDVLRETAAEAQATLTNAGFRVATIEQPSEDVPEGSVVSQTPQPGVEAARNTVVRLVVSSGPDRPTVPNVVNQPEGDARAAIQGEGLQVEAGSSPSSTIAAGNVIEQNPAPGTEVEPGSTVRILISTGPEPVSVPGVVGVPRDEAVAILGDAGLRPNVQTVNVIDPAQDGIVIAQNPEQGSEALPGDRVRINVGRAVGAPPPTTVETLPPTTTTP